jgi:predicted sulfurtransferase
VVTFCTGGIRCEKAAIHMQNIGYERVYQLEGGILKYFEEVGGEHYTGDCFVFDYRTALNPKLEPTETVQCFACRAVVTPRQQLAPEYVVGKSCPHCRARCRHPAYRRGAQAQQADQVGIAGLGQVALAGVQLLLGIQQVEVDAHAALDALLGGLHQQFAGRG